MLKLKGTSRNDYLATYNIEDHIIIGFAGNDDMFGYHLGGEDFMTGGSGNDKMFGYNDNDFLYGDDGNDYLAGGEGMDYLTGGKGADHFAFHDIAESGITPSTMDTITDFSHKEKDMIFIAGFDADTYVDGDQAFIFIGSAPFSASGQLRFDPSTHVLSGNSDNYVGAEFAVLLLGVTSLVASDFYLSAT